MTTVWCSDLDWRKVDRLAGLAPDGDLHVRGHHSSLKLRKAESKVWEASREYNDTHVGLSEEGKGDHWLIEIIVEEHVAGNDHLRDQEWSPK